MGHIPNTKKMLVKEIHFLSGYTYTQIEEKYSQALNKHPGRQKYYARKYAIHILQGWLKSLREEERLKNQVFDYEDEQSNAGIDFEKNHECNL